MEKQVNNIRNITKIYMMGSRMLEIVLVVVLCILAGKVMDYIYIRDWYNDSASWEKAILKEFYLQKKNIDYLYLGSSHVYRDVIPDRMDEINGKNNFNLATSSQPYMASYYLLKEAAERNDLEHVYMEMYYVLPYMFGNRDSAEVMTKNWDVLYQMPLSLNKLDYMCNLANKKYGIMTFFPVRRVAEHVFDAEYIRANLIQKRTEDYRRNIHILDEQAPLFKKGFCTTLNHVEQGTFEGNSSPIQEQWIDSESKKYLCKIIEFCQKEKIDITLFTSPMPDFRLCCMGNYDQYIKKVNEVADEYGIHYYDFNLCNTKYLNLQDDSCFTDYDHLSYEGSLLYTDILGEVLLSEIERRDLPDQVFYSTYEEKLASIEHRIFGLDIQQDMSKEEKTYMLYSVDNLTDTVAEFRVSKIGMGDKETIVQEWSTQNCVVFPAEESGVFIVEARPRGNKKVTNRVETEY